MSRSIEIQNFFDFLKLKENRDLPISEKVLREEPLTFKEVRRAVNDFGVVFIESQTTTAADLELHLPAGNYEAFDVNTIFIDFPELELFIQPNTTLKTIRFHSTTTVHFADKTITPEYLDQLTTYDSQERRNIIFNDKNIGPTLIKNNISFKYLHFA